MLSSEAIKIAQNEIGYTEQPANSNLTKYGKWYGLDGQPWCVMFLQWIFKDTNLLKRTASSSTLANWFKSNGQFFDTAQEGDIVFFKFSKKDVFAEHVGIVESVAANGSIWSIEGNTSIAGSQSNGGMVCRKHRSTSIVGYGRPKYNEQIGRATLSRGSRGSDVVYLQTRLASLGYTVGDIDGIFGRKTESAVRVFQADFSLEVDGIVGKKTWEILR